MVFETQKGKDKDKGKDKGKGKESAPEVQEMYVDGCEDVRPFRVGALDIKHKRAVAALWQLQRAMGWAVLDGGHDRELISDIIKEAVALHVFVEDGHRAGHAMHLASKVDAMALRERSGMPAPVSGSGGLRWAREMVHGREALFLDEQGRFRPPPEEGMKTASEQASGLQRGTSSDGVCCGRASRVALVTRLRIATASSYRSGLLFTQARTLESGEMLLPLMTQLRQMGRTLGCMFYQEACMQAAAIHSVLVSQSSDYAARLCFARTPVVDPVVPLPVLMRPGVVLATWYGTRAVPEAYEAWSKLHEGVLPAADGKRTLGGMELVVSVG